MSGGIVIIGAGQAGLQAAANLRQLGHQGAIALIGAERAPPYQRPPLSKAFLEGKLAEERLYLKPLAFYEKEDIRLITGLRAARIAPEVRSVFLESGETLAYEKLLIATGAPARRLNVPGTELRGVFHLRTLDDSRALAPALMGGARLVVIGAGYVGLEVAAAARRAGMNVAIVEAQTRALARVAPPEVSAHFEALHRAHGVSFHFGAGVAAIEGAGSVEGVRLADGTVLAADAVLVAIGASPAIALAAEAGLATADGVLVDESTATSDPFIFAAGDVASHPSPLYGRRIRLESAPNAIDQAKVAAAAMLGLPAFYDATPWFWSDQYDAKLQIAGLSTGAEETVTRRLAPDGPVSFWSFAKGRLIAVDAVSDTLAFQVGKRLIAARAAPAPKALADPGLDLKSLLAAAGA